MLKLLPMMKLHLQPKRPRRLLRREAGVEDVHPCQQRRRPSVMLPKAQSQGVVVEDLKVQQQQRKERARKSEQTSSSKRQLQKSSSSPLFATKINFISLGVKNFNCLVCF